MSIYITKKQIEQFSGIINKKSVIADNVVVITIPMMINDNPENLSKELKEMIDKIKKKIENK